MPVELTIPGIARVGRGPGTTTAAHGKKHGNHTVVTIEVIVNSWHLPDLPPFHFFTKCRHAIRPPQKLTNMMKSAQSHWVVSAWLDLSFVGQGGAHRVGRAEFAGIAGQWISLQGSVTAYRGPAHRVAEVEIWLTSSPRRPKASD